MSKKEMTPNGTKNTYCQENYYDGRRESPQLSEVKKYLKLIFFYLLPYFLIQGLLVLFFLQWAFNLRALYEEIRYFKCKFLDNSFMGR